MKTRYFFVLLLFILNACSTILPNTKLLISPKKDISLQAHKEPSVNLHQRSKNIGQAKALTSQKVNQKNEKLIFRVIACSLVVLAGLVYFFGRLILSTFVKNTTD